MSHLARIIKEQFSAKRVVVVGDLVADQFLRGTIARVSREAPVFILRHDETETLAGGAANAATNVASLGAGVSLVGLVGRDARGDALLARLAESGVDCRHTLATGKFSTTTKVRVLAGQHYAPRQQVIRIDYENEQTIDAETIHALAANLREAAAGADALIVSDYNYGVARPEIFALARNLAAENGIPLLVDSRFRLRDFPGATTATPNQDEVEQILGQNYTAADCAALCRTLGYEALLVTRGNKGMLLAERGREPVALEAVGPKEPIDVTGAGDTVIAAYALGLACGLGYLDSATLANHAGGIVVMKKGTAAVSADELLASLARHEPAEHKTQTP